MRRGYEIDLICMKIRDAPLKETIEGINVIHIGPVIDSPPNRSVVDMFYFVLAVFYWLITHEYDVVEGHGVGLFGVFSASKFTKARSVAVIHDLSSGNKDQWIGFSGVAEGAERLLCRLRYDNIITVSKGVKKRLIKEFQVQSRVQVINNGVDVE